MVNDDVDVLDYGDSPPPEDEPASAVAVTPVILPVPAPATSAPPLSSTPTTVPPKVEARASTAKRSTARKASSSAVLDLASSSKDGVEPSKKTVAQHRTPPRPLPKPPPSKIQSLLISPPFDLIIGHLATPKLPSACRIS
ncbi:hypothetical protein C8J57DRAFT_1504195 [Mycena rebaudengoi]|nr:hypothetical protein C8J57DRAFT_1504195 [Mycena rebaudengoi]